MSAHPQPAPPAETAPSRLIAVATADGETLDTHGGRVKRFSLYRLPAEGGAIPAGRIEIPDEEVLHLCGDGRRHVIDAVSAVIVGPSGEGFVKHMQRRGIEAVTTAADSVTQALADYLAGAVVPAEPPAHPHEHHDSQS
jgi:predicted Fe-Mo cluster-binding NifX family protein